MKQAKRMASAPALATDVQEILDLLLQVVQVLDALLRLLLGDSFDGLLSSGS